MRWRRRAVRAPASYYTITYNVRGFHAALDKSLASNSLCRNLFWQQLENCGGKIRFEEEKGAEEMVELQNEDIFFIEEGKKKDSGSR